MHCKVWRESKRYLLMYFSGCCLLLSFNISMTILNSSRVVKLASWKKDSVSITNTYSVESNNNNILSITSLVGGATFLGVSITMVCVVFWFQSCYK